MRTTRSHLPGAAFHLTARTQGHDPWFTEGLRTRITEFVAWAIRTSDSRLLAYAIMPNHLHLVIRQGEERLDRLMQPLLRRTALLVQRHHRIEGHIFERRFRDTPCLTPRHLRNTILYANLNALRAGLVDPGGSYTWSSHGLYLAETSGPECMRNVVALDEALRLFALNDGPGQSELRQGYIRYLNWRIERDQHLLAEQRGEQVGPPPPPPSVPGGDRWWRCAFVSPARAVSECSRSAGRGARASRLDLSDIAKQALAERAPGMPLELVRSAYKGRRVAAMRRLIVCRMSAAGYPGRAIARYLRVSEQCVSKILSTARRSTAS